MNYRQEIDGLRALAVLPVIFFHAGFESFQGGYIGVDIFFVVSGYLIATLLITQIELKEFNLLNFYERRARRILPALFLVILVSLPFAILWLTPSDLKSFGQSLIAISLFSSNFLFWQESGYFETAAELKPFLHTWSLSVEEQFYVLFPIFLLIAWKYGIRFTVVTLVAILLISLGLAEAGSRRASSAAFFLLPSRGWEILVGVIAAFYLKYRPNLNSINTNQFLSLLGLLMILYSILNFDDKTPFPSLYTLIPVFGSALLIFAALPGTLIYKFLTIRVMTKIGVISYSSYLWHQPLFAMTKYGFFDDIPNLLKLMISLLALFLAYFSYTFVEKPFRDGSRFSSKQILVMSLLGTMLLSLVGIFLNSNQGHNILNTQSTQNIYDSFDERGAYVTKRFKELHLRDFSNKTSKIKVILIGDSFAEDISNAVYESELIHNIELSTYRIPGFCGVLMLDIESISTYMKEECKFRPSFNNVELLKLIKEADQVWLASDWPYWTEQFLEESLINIKNLKKDITVFGIKSFGFVDSRVYKFFKEDTWNDPFFKFSKERYNEIAKANQRLEHITKSVDARFIDIQSLICDGKNQCPNFVKNNIISYDGKHLTPHGARIVGYALNENL